MKKFLLLLLGMFLIALLTYFCFKSKSEMIKNDLNSRATMLFADNQIDSVHTDIKGDEFSLTRELVLTGTVSSEEEKERAAKLANNVVGIRSVQNLLTISKKTLSENREEETIVQTILAQSPYETSAIKEKTGMVLLTGYVPSKKAHAYLLLKAEEKFGKDKIIDNLKVAKGIPKEWQTSVELGLSQLAHSDYGNFKIVDNNFSFDAHVGTAKEKEMLLSNLSKSLPSNYQNVYNIETEAIPNKIVASNNIEIPQNLPIVNEDTVTAQSCQESFIQVLKKDRIRFAYNQAKIRIGSHKLLQELVEVIKGCPNKHIIIAGHTDSDGKKIYNKQLSQKRANAVKKYLISHGINATQLKAIGYGESKPVADNATKNGKKLNRRIEFNVKGIE